MEFGAPLQGWKKQKMKEKQKTELKFQTNQIMRQSEKHIFRVILSREIAAQTKNVLLPSHRQTRAGKTIKVQNA